MAQFSVDTGQVSDLSRQLDTVRSHLDGLTVQAAVYAGELGSPHLDDAVKKFADHWSDGVSLIGRQIDHLVHKLQEAAGAYDSTDTDIATAAHTTVPTQGTA